MILFQLYFDVPDDKRSEFESAYTEVFEPALSRQEGFRARVCCVFFRRRGSPRSRPSPLSTTTRSTLYSMRGEPATMGGECGS